MVGHQTGKTLLALIRRSRSFSIPLRREHLKGLCPRLSHTLLSCDKDVYMKGVESFPDLETAMLTIGLHDDGG